MMPNSNCKYYLVFAVPLRAQAGVWPVLVVASNAVVYAQAYQSWFLVRRTASYGILLCIICFSWARATRREQWYNSADIWSNEKNFTMRLQQWHQSNVNTKVLQCLLKIVLPILHPYLIICLSISILREFIEISLILWSKRKFCFGIKKWLLIPNELPSPKPGLLIH